MKIQKSILIDVPKQELWDITAHDFGNIYKWISGVNRSHGQGEGINGATHGERVCDPSYRGFKRTTERITAYDPNGFRFTYQVVSGLPSFVESASNTWTHETEGDGTRLTMAVAMKVKGIMGALMGGMMKSKMSKILTEALEELKTYAESGGDLHPRKRKAKEKYEKQQKLIA